MSRDNSITFCRESVHELATITVPKNSGETAFIQPNLKDDTLIGIRYINGTWMDENLMTPLVYTNWVSSPPDPTYNNCARMAYTGPWVGWRCVMQSPPICSYSVNYTCYGILSIEEGVCNGRGRCRGVDDCLCIEGYTGEKCQDYICNDIPSSNLEVVCGSESGLCIGPDDCLCTKPNTYGKFCEETILNGTFYIDVDVITFQYKVSVDLLTETYFVEDLSQVYFNCLDIVGFETNSTFLKYNKVNGGSCAFNYDENRENTTLLVIDLGTDNSKANSKEGQLNILMSPVTFLDEKKFTYFSLSITHGQVGESTEEGGSNTGTTTTIVVLVVSILVILFMIVILVVCIVTTIVLVIYRANKRQKNTAMVRELGIVNMIDGFKKDATSSNHPTFEVNTEMFKINIDDLKIKSMLGKGGGGQVYFAKWNKIDVAFKIFDVFDFNVVGDGKESSDFGEFEKELNIINSLSHPNILKFYGYCFCEKRIGMVIEYCEHGDLLNYFDKLKWVYTNEMKLKCLLELSLAMVYLHNNNIIHRDLKLENILVSKDLDMKLCDFGTSKIKSKTSNRNTRRIGTTIYMAPEIVFGDMEYTEKCDVFSFSIILCQVLMKKYNVYEVQLFGLESKVAKDESYRPDISEIGVGEVGLRGLMVNCWNHDPQKRPGFDEIYDVLEAEAGKLK